MSPAVRLGLRLAVGTPGQRTRSALVVAATGIGSWLLLSTLAVGHAIAVTDNGYSSVERERLALAVVTSVGLPVLVLAATVGRLSAAVRDRRLANLRLLGLGVTGTRVVAASEAGAAALLGALAGAAVAVATRAWLAGFSFAGHSWARGAVSPTLLGWALVLVGLPVVVVAAAALPVRMRAADALARARRAATGRPSAWWAAPLIVGVALIGLQLSRPMSDHDPGAWWFLTFFGGAILSGLGVLLVAPWVVRGVADLLLKLSPGPATVIAARRMQAQPGGVVRVVSVLMLGLYLVAGARSVVSAFEDTNSYRDADESMHVAQRIVFQGSARQADRAGATARTVPGVRDVVVLPTLTGSAQEAFGRSQVSVLVATCSQLLRIQPSLRGCVDAPMVVENGLTWSGTLSLGPLGQSPLRIPIPTRTLRGPAAGEWPGPLAPVEADVVLPPRTPGVGPLLAGAGRTGVVLGPPGRGLDQRLDLAGVGTYVSTDWGYYDFVNGLRAILWAVATVVLGVGLLTLALAGADRALARRRELAALQVLGTPRGVLRRAQLLEAAVPAVLGSLLAIATGLAAGASYLRIGGEPGTALPIGPVVDLATAAVLAALLVAAATVAATDARLTPNLIRRE